MGRTAQVALWTLAWLLTLALATFGPDRVWDGQPAATWAAIAANVAVGIGLIVAYGRYLQGLDELQRKIEMDALALTLGVGFVAGFAYVAAYQADLVGPDPGVFPTLLGVVYIIAVAVGRIRYR